MAMRQSFTIAEVRELRGTASLKGECWVRTVGGFYAPLGGRAESDLIDMNGNKIEEGGARIEIEIARRGVKRGRRREVVDARRRRRTAFEKGEEAMVGRDGELRWKVESIVDVRRLSCRVPRPTTWLEVRVEWAGDWEGT